MRQVHRSRVTRFAFLATSAMLVFGGNAMAQTVRMFDDTPSLDQLRSIMIPESQPGASRSIVLPNATRSIVLQRQDPGAASSSVQQVATQVMPAQRKPVEAAPAAPIVKAAASVAAPKANAAGEPGAVGFHVNFAFDSAVLPESAYSMIDLMAQLMKEAPEVKVRVEGHTDATGSLEYNKTLSERRAMAVAQYLVNHGVEPSRLILAGKGPMEPLPETNRYDPTNRRVQFVRVI